MRLLARFLRWLAALVDRPARPVQAEKISAEHADMKKLEAAHFVAPRPVARPGALGDLWWTYDQGWYPTHDVTPFASPRDLLP